MGKQPGIFIKTETIRDAHHPTQGNPDGFKANVGALIDAGHAVAVGENQIEEVFDSSKKFKDWFDSIAPEKIAVEDPPKVPFKG
jgi:hypothetical protein